MGRVKEHMIEVCELFGRDPAQLETEDDWDEVNNLCKLVDDLDDHAQDYGWRTKIDAASRSIRFVDDPPRQTRCRCGVVEIPPDAIGCLAATDSGGVLVVHGRTACITDATTS